MLGVLKMAEGEEKDGPLGAFFARFDAASREEWFDDAAAVESYFADEANFARLIGQEFDKLNILFTVILLNGYKPAFDRALMQVLKDNGVEPTAVDAVASYAFALFPPLCEDSPDSAEVPVNLAAMLETAVAPASPKTVKLKESVSRVDLRQLLAELKGRTLSKILNTQGIALRDLTLIVE